MRRPDSRIREEIFAPFRAVEVRGRFDRDALVVRSVNELGEVVL